MLSLKFIGCFLFRLSLKLLLLIVPSLILRACIAGKSCKMIFNNKKRSLLYKIFPLELLPCSTFRIHARERDQKVDEERKTKGPSSYTLSSSAYQLGPTEKRTPIEVFQLPASSGDSLKGERGTNNVQEDEAKASLTSPSPAISRETSRKWMAFESDITKACTENFDRIGSSFAKRLETDITERIAEELKSDVLSSLQLTFVVSDATKPDCPIMFASNGFLVMTGYTSEEVIGRNCRFLQGPESDKNEVAKIRDAIRKGNSYCGKILNYKKNGTPFWNFLTIGPVKDSHGNTIKFVGMQVEISKNAEEKEKTMRSMSITEDQTEKAIRSIVEAQAVRSLRSYIRSKRYETNRKHKEPETTNVSYDLHMTADNADYEIISIPDSQKAQSDLINGLSYSNSYDNLRPKSGVPGLVSSTGFKETPLGSIEHEGRRIAEISVLKPEDGDHVAKRERDMRRGIDLATSLERIEKSFFITNPRLPDNPIIFASDRFLDSTEYTREEVIGRNIGFLQGPETDQATISRIKDAIEEQKEITVQIINYTRSGKKFLNLFHLQPVYGQKGELQYFISVQLDAKPSSDRLSEILEHQSAKVKAIAEHVGKAVFELPDANLKSTNLWEIYCQPVLPRPHKKYSSSWTAIRNITSHGEEVGLRHFKPIKPLGFGDIGSVHLVELKGTGEFFAMKAIEKSAILNRNKVHRACIEREVIALLDHPFMPTLYSSFQTPTHIFLIMDFCPGGELFALLDKQPTKMFKEEVARFYAAEVVIALEYLHCLGIIYRDLKPENVLLQKDGHIVLTDFDLSFKTSDLQTIESPPPKKTRYWRELPSVFIVEPAAKLNSFIGTEEYIAPEIIRGDGHSSSVDWWTLGILLYEMLYGRTPFKGKNRRKTFANILFKDLTFPFSIQVSLAAKKLMDALLQRDPARRLGSRTGADEIKRHPFFHQIDWPKIRTMTPPSPDVALQIIERVTKDGAVSNSTGIDIF